MMESPRSEGSKEQRVREAKETRATNPRAKEARSEGKWMTKEWSKSIESPSSRWVTQEASGVASAIVMIDD